MIERMSTVESNRIHAMYFMKVSAERVSKFINRFQVTHFAVLGAGVGLSKIMIVFKYDMIILKYYDTITI